MSVTLRGPSRSSLVARAALLTSVVVLVVVVVAGDRGARRHSAWRDPISWFAADEAPHPYWTRAALVVVAGSLVVVALTWWRASRVGAAVVAFFAGLVLALALIPLECAPRIGFCQALMRHDRVGWQHLTHAALAGVGVVAVIGVALMVVVRDRRTRTRGAALAAIVAGGWMLLDPAGARLGSIQWAFLAAAAVVIASLGPAVPGSGAATAESG